MKKLLAILAMLLALLMIGAVAVAQSADDDDDSMREGIPYEDIRRVHELDGHDVENPRVVKEPTCTAKGIVRFDCAFGDDHFHEAYIKPLGHEWKLVDTKIIGTKDVCCEENYVCERCGATKKETIKTHEWASESGETEWGRVTKEPKCYDPGEAEDYCLVCDIANDDVLPRKIYVDHDFSVRIESADCLSEDVIVTYKCKYCPAMEEEDGKIKEYHEDKDPEKDYHDWDKWVKESDATCAVGETWVRWCKRCGDKQEKVGDPLEPKWVIKEKRLLDCYTELVSYTCENCHGKVHPDRIDEEVEVEAHVYKFEKKYLKEEVKPTCTEDGTREYYCIYDESHPTYVEILPALGHDWEDWELRVAPGQGENEYGYWLRQCKRCKAYEEKIAQHQPPELCEGKHDWIIWGEKSVEPICTVEGKVTYVCSKCGTEKVEVVKALGHDLFEEVVTEPTCSKEGKKLVSCKRCDYLDVIAIEKLPHTEVVLPAIPGDCLTDGWTEGKECSVCGATLVAREKIPAIGHHDYVKVDAVEPTCTVPGCTAGTVCSVCGDVLVAPVEIPAKGHTEVEIPAVEPTCTKAGSTAGKICSVCNEVIEAVKEVPATGHKWDDGKITKEATPTEDGVKTFTCTACGETRTEAVPFEFDEEAAYKLEDMSYAANKITGKAVHDAATVESDKLYARVTVFFVGGTYAVFADYVEDGVIDIEVHGTVLAVSVSLTGSKNVVPGAEMVVFDTWGEYYAE